MIVVVLAAYFGVALITSYCLGRYRKVGDDFYEAMRPVDDEERRLRIAVSMLWPICGPLFLMGRLVMRGDDDRRTVVKRQAEIDKEIREAMPEVERLLGEALTPEVRTFIQNVRQIGR